MVSIVLTLVKVSSFALTAHPLAISPRLELFLH
jgi:hypothetical protein